ncbi:FHA domain-containing protein [Actinopolymorpha cephalotaxi]|uniref:FHA domain-containing protein n=1 Tax=Actinopolymorpha cephalotaxi TaxID=504797 RepID=A0A1I2UC04_9ACTN|nr:FHA domain-containing protein [Actinopolymorpha cephalotaxi]NYH86527.1 pSer/pThr/pTyr-binding forkhead associated (FHA) protein [Actinopolymorpha cephalotaxi]SFG74672.1 FHA domain-containing protein [Actinopolymorpha cephalotaxi]
MSELTLTIIKLGFLAVLWLFVLSAVSVIRSDLFGTRVSGSAKSERPQKKPSKPTKPPRRKRGEPTTAVVVQGASSGLQVPLGDSPLVIGRGGECELQIDDEYVSTRHAVLRPQSGSWYAEDLGSTNGTFVGESRIHGPTAVGPGIPVRVGKTIIELYK